VAAAAFLCALAAPGPRTAPLPERALAVAWLKPAHFAVLFARWVGLYRWSGEAPALLSRADLPCHGRAVRWPGGLLAAHAAESSLWAMTSLSTHAVLLAADGDRLAVREQAAAVPWPGSRSGLRLRPDTSLLEGDLEGVGAGPFLAVAGGDAAVGADGRLLRAGAAQEAPRVGSALARAWPGWLLASSPAPPGEPDGITLLPADGPAVSAVILPGSVGALAARVDGDHVVTVLAVTEGETGPRLWLAALERPRP
jgi:hypothetical protein